MKFNLVVLVFATACGGNPTINVGSDDDDLVEVGGDAGRKPASRSVQQDEQPLIVGENEPRNSGDCHLESRGGELQVAVCDPIVDAGTPPEETPREDSGRQPPPPDEPEPPAEEEPPPDEPPPPSTDEPPPEEPPPFDAGSPPHEDEGEDPPPVEIPPPPHIEEPPPPAEEEPPPPAIEEPPPVVEEPPPPPHIEEPPPPVEEPPPTCEDVCEDASRQCGEHNGCDCGDCGEGNTCQYGVCVCEPNGTITSACSGNIRIESNSCGVSWQAEICSHGCADGVCAEPPPPPAEEPPPPPVCELVSICDGDTKIETNTCGETTAEETCAYGCHDGTCKYRFKVWTTEAGFEYTVYTVDGGLVVGTFPTKEYQAIYEEGQWYLFQPLPREGYVTPPSFTVTFVDGVAVSSGPPVESPGENSDYVTVQYTPLP